MGKPNNISIDIAREGIETLPGHYGLVVPYGGRPIHVGSTPLGVEERVAFLYDSFVPIIRCSREGIISAASQHATSYLMDIPQSSFNDRKIWD